MEKQLEDFLVPNRCSTSLGREYDIFEVDGSNGQKFPTDTDPMEILAISKNWTRLLVIEPKMRTGERSHSRPDPEIYGYVQDALLESGQSVDGVIIAQEDDQKIRHELFVAQSRFSRYRVEFHLEP